MTSSTILQERAYNSEEQCLTDIHSLWSPSSSSCTILLQENLPRVSSCFSSTLCSVAPHVFAFNVPSNPNVFPPILNVSSTTHPSRPGSNGIYEAIQSTDPFLLYVAVALFIPFITVFATIYLHFWFTYLLFHQPMRPLKTHSTNLMVFENLESAECIARCQRCKSENILPTLKELTSSY